MTMTAPTPTAKAAQLSLKPLRRSLRSVLFAAGQDMARPMMTGVHAYCRGKGEPLVVEATDSYRAHQVRLDNQDNPPFDVLIPARWLRVTLANLGGDPYSTIAFDGPNVTAAGYGETRSIGLLENGNRYPDLQRFIDAPDHHDPQAEVAVKATFLRDMFRAADLWEPSPLRFSIPSGRSQPIRAVVKAPGAVVTMVLMPVRVP